MSSFFSLLNSTFPKKIVEFKINNEKIMNSNYESKIPHLKIQNIGLKLYMSEQIPLKNENLSASMLSKNMIEPLTIDNIVLLCYGDIYNSRELFESLDISPITNYSYEIIIHLYKLFGIEQTLKMIDGVFSFLLLDNNIESDCLKLYVARDCYGIKPLYILNPIKKNIKTNNDSINEYIIGFSTNKKMLFEMYKEINLNNIYNKKDNNQNLFYELKQFLPGTYSSYILSSKILSSWINKKENVKFHMLPFNPSMFIVSPQYNNENIVKNIHIYLIRSIEKYCNNFNSTFACYLDGSIESSIIAGLLKQYNIIHSLPTLKTFSIGMQDSINLQKSKIVAKYLNTEHTEFNITDEHFTKEYLESILDLECYNDIFCNKIIHRDFIYQYFLGKMIKDENISVIFNGNGANELFGNISIINRVNDSISFDYNVCQCVDNLFTNELNISDLSLFYNGFSPSSPFLDRSFVESYLSIPHQIRFNSVKTMEKYFLRLAFSKEYYTNVEGKYFLPDDIIWDSFS